MKKYLELYNKVKEKIIQGEYKSGDKMPSKRVVADREGVSVITVEAAYSLLIDEGYIVSREKRGYFVADIDILPHTNISERIMINYLSEEEEKKDMDFEYSLWFKTVRKLISEKGEKLFYKSPSKGCAVLRNAISDYLLRYREMVAQPCDIIIGSGAEQLYETAVKILGRDKIYGIENPSYHRIEKVYEGMGVKIRKLKMGSDGIESEALKNSDMDVLHVTPFSSYPTGVTTSLQKRYEYLKWSKGGGYIIEDDFNSEFFKKGQGAKTLYSLEGGKNVIYINTFSKSLSPSMRMGYMILPRSLSKNYDELLGDFSCTVPVLDQQILAEFIKSGDFERHLNRMRRKMKNT